MSSFFEIEKFDMTSRELSELTIKEIPHLDTCGIVSMDGSHYFNSFVLDRNTQTEILCEVTFYRSSKSKLYIPRLVFSKCKLNGEGQSPKGEKIRIDISSSAFPHYVPHTNQKGLFSEQKTAKVAKNTVYLDGSYIELPILSICDSEDREQK